MIIEGKTGDLVLSNGVVSNVKIDRRGSLVVRDALAQAVIEGRAFSCANQAAVATTAALATTWTGLCVSNPTGSGKNMIVHEFGWSQTVAGSADGAVGLILCTIAAPASNITIYNRLSGGAGSSMIADDGATIANPVLLGTYGSLGTLAVTGYGSQGPNVIKLDGSIVIAPGYTLATYSTKATTASLIHHIVWEEVPA